MITPELFQGIVKPDHVTTVLPDALIHVEDGMIEDDTNCNPAAKVSVIDTSKSVSPLL